MTDMPSVDVLKAFARYRPARQKRVAGMTYAELIEALKADPDEALSRFRALLGDRGYNIRYWACYAGAEICGRKFVPDLQAAFNDGSQTVQEAAMWSLLEMDPSGRLLQPLLPGMRRSVVRWNYDGAFGPVRLLALMKDIDAVPYLERYLARSDIDKADRARGEVYLLYLKDGIQPILQRIRDHSGHDRMYALCQVAAESGSPDVGAAMQELIASDPDDHCRAVASESVDALRVARTKGPGPYLLGLRKA